MTERQIEMEKLMEQSDSIQLEIADLRRLAQKAVEPIMNEIKILQDKHTRLAHQFMLTRYGAKIGNIIQWKQPGPTGKAKIIGLLVNPVSILGKLICVSVSKKGKVGTREFHAHGNFEVVKGD